MTLEKMSEENVSEKITNKIMETKDWSKSKDKKHFIQALNIQDVVSTKRDKIAKGQIRTNTLIRIYLNE